MSLAQDTNDKQSIIENHYHKMGGGRGQRRGPYKFLQHRPPSYFCRTAPLVSSYAFDDKIVKILELE